ncbi:MAG: peptide ABC transporter ATP-binding protein [Planctomycetaceae bacterium]|nr:peptide ABC transporter ATP-binding protein [Planctomycetaceae bacterium]
MSTTSESLPDVEPAGDAQSPLLSVRDLVVTFAVEGGVATAVDGISFDVFPNEVLGIVGESGSGKSVTALSVMRLVPDPPGKLAGGAIVYKDRDIAALSYEEMRSIRGNEIAMIFQEPMTALNPVFTVGMQVMETVITHEKLHRKEAFERAVEMLEKVGIPEARARMGDYPHQFSGGMRQRVMIALALICHPTILIADEPTTALDVTTQAQILDLMLELKQKSGGASILLITHDLAVVAETCQRVVVLYGGVVQEIGTAEQIFNTPLHPYTQGLLASLPAMHGDKHDRLHAIPGNVPSILELPTGCKFCTRCEKVEERCRTQAPPLYELGAGQQVRCHLMEGRGDG